MTAKTIRIGGACGYWGDSAHSTAQLLGARLDYLVYDYLAEVTMSIMARARAASPEAGYAVDFVQSVLRPNLPEIAAKGVRVISNAGGVNPAACGAAVRAVVKELGLDLSVAVVLGDDLMNDLDALRAQAPTEMFSGAPFPETDKVLSANAYLGAVPIARALALGADIVITGRCVDSAVTLGACLHEFGWAADDWDRLAGGSLAGHILECGAQATGGNFTDWHLLNGEFDRVGYPIAEVSDDGSFVCTKPIGTGGLVNRGTVGEQMLYEIGDPQAYILPDVVCDFAGVTIDEIGPDRVRVSGARGYPATSHYKVSVTSLDGYRGGFHITFYGPNSDEKARSYAEAVIRGAREQMRAKNLADFAETSVEVLGVESQYGSHAALTSSREVVVKIAVKHEDAKGVAALLRTGVSIALASPPGMSGFSGARPKPSPMVRLYSALVPKDTVSVTIECGGQTEEVAIAPGASFDTAAIERPTVADATPTDDMTEVRLQSLAYGRSGDKGNSANIGIMARKAEFAPWIRAALTETIVAERFLHFSDGSVTRFDLPGSYAINFLLTDVLGGGGVASLRNDAQGKGYAQLLMDLPIALPSALAEAHGLTSSSS